MFTQIRLELIGWKTWQDDRLQMAIADRIVPGVGRNFARPSPWWVAEITGRSRKYRYARSFIQPHVDYTMASDSFNRGVFAYYLVESGRMYEVKEKTPEENLRYFLTVSEHGEKIKLTEEELNLCLDRSVS